jgi:hypothetical protein
VRIRRRRRPPPSPPSSCTAAHRSGVRADLRSVYPAGMPRSTTAAWDRCVAQAFQPNAVYLRSWPGCWENISSFDGIEFTPEPRRMAGRHTLAPDEAGPRLRGAAESGVGLPKKNGASTRRRWRPWAPGKSVSPHPAARDGACRISVPNPGLRCASPGATADSGKMYPRRETRNRE